MGTSGWCLTRSCQKRGLGTPSADPEKHESRSIVSGYQRAADTKASQVLNGNHKGVVCRGSVDLTLNFGSYFAPANLGRGHPFSIHLALAFFSWDLKFSMTTLSLTWILRALDTLISMLGFREYTGTTLNSM